MDERLTSFGTDSMLIKRILRISRSPEGPLLPTEVRWSRRAAWRRGCLKWIL